MAFTLAHELGYADPLAMCRQIPAETLDYWRAFYALGRPGMRLEIANARLAHYVVSLFSKKSPELMQLLPKHLSGHLKRLDSTPPNRESDLKNRLFEANFKAWGMRLKAAYQAGNN